jgi:hypothetical protein
MIAALSRRIERLDARGARLRLYALLTGAYFLMALVLGRADGPRDGVPFNLITSDGRDYYVYLPSLFLDGDLDFENQLREHWGAELTPRHLVDRTENGRIRNKNPIGMALTLLPAFLLGHVLALILYGLTGSAWFVCDGYSLPYQLCCLATITALAWATLALADRLLTGRFRTRGRFAAAGVCLTSCGTHLAFYSFRQPFLVHVVSLFWCTLCVSLTDRLLTELERRRLSWGGPALLGLSLALAVLCRPTNLFLLPFVLYLVVRAWQAGLLRDALARVPVALAVAAVPLLAQLTVWRVMTDHWLWYSYGKEGFLWSRPALWETLFSSRHGLLFWSPLLVLALTGLAGRLRRDGPDGLLLCSLAGCMILWYCNSAWHCWWFGASFGGRAFLELSVLFAFGLAFRIERVWTGPSRARRLGQLAFVVLAVAYNWALMWLYFKRYIPEQDYLF